VNSTATFLNSTSADALVLFALRVGGLVLVAPVFSSKVVPMTLRSGLIVLFTWLLAPVVIAKDSTAVLTPATAMTETLIGFALGVGAAVFVGAAEAMGELLSLSVGLSGAATLDPMSFTSVPVMGQFANLMVVALLLSSNAHHLMLQALAASVQAIPVGGAVQLQTGLAGVIGLGSTLFLLGLRFAAPILAVVLLGNAALAILTRVAPQVNVLSVAFPLQIGLGLFAFASAIPLIGGYFAGWPSMYEEIVVHLLRGFGAGAH
jgi:flagellar biosynthetic protein FliR